MFASLILDSNIEYGREKSWSTAQQYTMIYLKTHRFGCGRATRGRLEVSEKASHLAELEYS